MIVIVANDRFHYQAYHYPDGSDGVVVINYEVGSDPVFVVNNMGQINDINDMDDSEIDLLNKSVEFVHEFGTLRRTK